MKRKKAAKKMASKKVRRKAARKSTKKAAKKKSIRTFGGKGLRRPARSMTRRLSKPMTHVCGVVGKTTGEPCGREVGKLGEKCWQHRTGTA